MTTNTLHADVTYCLRLLAILREHDARGFAFESEITREAHGDLDPMSQDGLQSRSSVAWTLADMVDLGWTKLSAWKGSAHDATWSITRRGHAVLDACAVSNEPGQTYTGGAR